MHVFSFCIYGSQKKYCQGLLENLLLIKEHYPTFQTWIYIAPDVPSFYKDSYEQHANVRLIDVPRTGGELMCHRFFPIDSEEVDVCFCRDADSRISERDRWCIDQFLQSSKKFHIIRDHYQHQMRIMGGMWGIKKGALPQPIKELYRAWLETRRLDLNKYGTDQLFLQDYIYPLVKDKSLIHCDYRFFKEETEVNSIAYKSNGTTDFIGNVVDFRPDGSTYFVFTK